MLNSSHFSMPAQHTLVFTTATKSGVKYNIHLYDGTYCEILRNSGLMAAQLDSELIARAAEVAELPAERDGNVIRIFSIGNTKVKFTAIKGEGPFERVKIGP